MFYKTLPIYNKTEFNKLKELYSKLEQSINCLNNATIELNSVPSFNNFLGDVTSGIKWTWAQDSTGIAYFDQFLKSIDFYNNIGLDNLHIRGASFITINEKTISYSDFHLDVMTEYKAPNNPETNILTVLFPLYELEKAMGHLEYKENSATHLYRYKTSELFVWDSCQFEHRTQPYTLNKACKRVLVSINLSTNKDWAKSALDKTTLSQGNFYSIKSLI
uniref:Prolyl 4-hydroxylase alpha subunit Fe(2+) 2OG dioxygenase domain-containing protein n=1 Tax=viral metagenome TaxID=1070528 RepID=A0A6C0EJQ2_9ZZZZ